MSIIPQEIYVQIFQYLNRRDLYICSFVCKNWYSLISSCYWKKVTFDNYGVRLMKSHLKEPNYKKYFKYGHLIKSLCLKGGSHNLNLNDILNFGKKYMEENNGCKFTKQELLLLLDQLPNITEITMDSGGYFREYMRYLLDANLQHIEKLPDYSAIDNFNSHGLHFAVCYKFRASITSLCLHYYKKTNGFSQYTNVLTTLAQFKSLTVLKFHNCCDQNLTPFHVLDNCSSLEYLEFESCFSISEASATHLLNDARRFRSSYFTSLRRLEILVPSLSNTYTQCIIKYFPNQLNTLNIKLYDQTIFNWIDTVTMEKALKFMEKIGIIKDTGITFSINDSFSRNLSNNSLRITELFRILNAFKGSRKTHCINDILEPGLIDVGHSYECKSNGELSFTYTFPQEDASSYCSYQHLALPDKKISVIGLEIINTLKVHCSFINNRVIHNILKYVYRNCPQAEVFINLISLSPLSFQKYPVIHYVCNERIKSMTLTSKTSYLLLNPIQLSQLFSDLTVNNYIFNIETLVLTTEDWGDKFINLTGLKQLKSFIFSSNDNRVAKDDMDMILFKYANGEKRYCFYYKLTNQARYAFVNKKTNNSNPMVTFFCKKSFIFELYRNGNKANFFYDY